MTKPIPPRNDFEQIISLTAIQKNDCSSLTEVTLYYGSTDDKDDTVRYVLLDDAAAVYRFQKGIPIRAKDENGKAFMAYLIVKRESDRAIVIRLKKDAPEFKAIALYLLLELIKKPKTKIDFDPSIGSGGGPRG